MRIAQPRLPHIREAVYDIRQFGAVPGVTESVRAAIQSAVDAAHSQGGGHVVIPAGIWLTGPLELKSGVDLHLELNAVLLFDKKKEAYPLIVTQYEGRERIRACSPLWARNAEDISITGNGIIDGNGHLWRMAKEFKFTQRDWKRMTMKQPNTLFMTEEGAVWFPTESSYEGFLQGEVELQREGRRDPEEGWEEAVRRAADYYDFYRPVMVSLIGCRRILIEGVTLQNSPAWNVHPLFCEDVTIRNAQIRNEPSAQNGDGLDLESCRRAEIAGVEFDVGDDAICMKSGKNAEARRITFPTEDVHIHDCRVLRGHGGFTVGSEMSRGVRNICVERCTFIGTDTGIRFKSALGRGGIVENITIRDINMLRIRDEAVIMTMGYVLSQIQSSFAGEGFCQSQEDIPEFGHIRFENIRCLGAGCGIRLEGLEQKKIHDISFQNVHIEAEKPGIRRNTERITFSDCRICDTVQNEQYQEI